MANNYFIIGGAGGFVISGSVDFYADLGDPVALDGQLWFVKNPEKAIFPKYPRGLYYATGGAWELTPIKVKISEDAGSVLNWTNWNDWFTGSVDIGIGDRILYNGANYVNLTGTQTSTAPDLDPTNWASYIQLQPTTTANEPPHQTGRMYYNKDENTFVMMNDIPDVRLNNGEELWARTSNGTASLIPNGKIVAITSAAGVLPEIVLADASNLDLSIRTFGMTTMDIDVVGGAYNGQGYVTRYGAVRGLDTSMCIAGDVIWLSPDNPGEFTNVKPTAPNYAVRLGVVIVVDALQGIIGIDTLAFNSTDTVVNFEGALNGVIAAVQTVNFIDDGVNVYADVTNATNPGKDLPVIFSGERYLLNTTTGAGAGGAARIQLNLGAAGTPQGNYIYVYLNAGVAELAVSTNFPVIDHAQIAIASVQDLADFQANGVQAYQRTNNSPNGSVSNGLLRVLADKTRFIGALYVDGIDPTLTIDTGPSPDSVNLSTTAGDVFQLRFQTFGATTGIEYWILNHPTLGVTRITDLNQITVDANGDSLTTNGIRFGLTFIGGQNSESITDKIYINLPEGSYGNDLDCINDVSNYQVSSVPFGIGLQTNAFRICRVCLRRNTTGGGTYENILDSAGLGNNQDERGFPLGTAGGGSGGTASQTLSSLHGDPAVTGLYLFSGLTLNGTTQVDVSSGSGQIVDFYNDYQAPVKTPVSWAAQTITIPNLGTDDSTYIYVDNTGTIQTQNTPFLPADDRTKLLLGFTINNTALGQLKSVIDVPTPIGITAQSFVDYMAFIGATSRGGTVSKTNDPGTNGDMALRVDAHTLFFPGVNWINSKTNPNELLFNAQDPVTFSYILSTGEITDVSETLIDPTYYDVAGVKTLVPTDAAGRRTTIQYVYQLVDGDYYVIWGQSLYEDLSVAQAELDNDAKNLTVPSIIKNFGTPLAAVLVSQNATDLDNELTSDIQQIESGSVSGSTTGTVAGFRAERSGTSVSVTSTVETVIIFNTEDFDQGSNYDETTGLFTAPTDGLYDFFTSLKFSVGASLGNDGAECRIYQNSTLKAAGASWRDVAGTIISSASVRLNLVQGDTVDVRAYQISGFTASVVVGGSTQFSGGKI